MQCPVSNSPQHSSKFNAVQLFLIYVCLIFCINILCCIFCSFILNYLRTGRLIFPRENKVLAAELLLEAEFYQIQGMAKEIWPGSTFQNSTYIVNSLTEDQRETLMSWLPTPVFTNWIQLFSSQVQGWSSANFHSLCNSKGPTVILARAGNFIFGGYAEVSWSSSK